MNSNKPTDSRKAKTQLVLAIASLTGLAALLGVALRIGESKVVVKPKQKQPIPAKVEVAEDSVQPILELNFPNAPAPVKNKLTALQVKLRKNNDDSRAIAAIAMTLMAHELKPAAIPCLEVLQSRKPNDYRWPYLLGHCRMFTKPDGAANDFRKATQLKPENVPSQMMLAEVYLANGRLEEAISLLGDSLPDNVKRHPWVAWQQSRLFTLLKQYDKSELLLEKLRKNGIVSRSLLRQLLMVKRRTQKDADLTSLSQDLADCPKELLSWECPVMVAVAREKIDTQVVLALAQAQLSQRNFRGAINVFKKAMAEQPNSPELMYYLAQLWLQSGDAERADGILQVASQFEGNSLRILQLRARIAMLRKDWELAQELCAKSLALKQDSADSWYVQAVTLQKQDLLAEARFSLNKSLQLDPKNPDALKLQKELDAE